MIKIVHCHHSSSTTRKDCKITLNDGNQHKNQKVFVVVDLPEDVWSKQIRQHK